MIRTLLLFCCLLFVAVSAALAQQGFRVSVLNDAEEPLIGAYIYVNEKAEAVTDILGLAVIPLEKIKLGDSISVSYIFAKDQSVVVDKAMLIKGEYEFIVEESHGTLLADAVVVKAKIKRLYRRSLPIKKIPPYGHYGLYSTHFTMNITNPGDSVPSQSVAGRLGGIYTSLYTLEKMFSVEYRSIAGHYFNPSPTVLDSLQRSGFSEGFVNEYPLEITTNDDTTNLEQTLKYFLPRALRANHLSFFRVWQPEPYGNYNELEMYPNLKVNYGYLGKDQDTSTFRLTYSGYGAGTTSEVVVKSDVANKINREIVEIALSFKDTINGNSYYVKAKTRDEIIDEYIDQTFGRSHPWQVPVELEYCIKESDGTRVNITMSNYNIRSVFALLYIPFSVIHNRCADMHGLIRPRLALEFFHESIDAYLQRVVRREQKLKEKQHKKGGKTRKPSSIFDD